jgi:hypothetical protein
MKFREYEFPATVARVPSLDSAMFSILILFIFAGCRTNRISSVRAESPEIRIPSFIQTADSGLSLIPKSTSEEMDLARSLFVETNGGFDARLCKSVGTALKSPALVSFRMINFIFFYSRTNDYLVPVCEMSDPDELICMPRKFSRKNVFTNEVPVNYIRLVDPRAREVTADLELLVSVAPLGNPKEVAYFRRSFRFAYRKGWIEINGEQR